MPKSIQKRKIKGKKAQRPDYDSDASEPYSDELNVSSPEFLEMDDGGEVIMNSDWTKSKKKSKNSQKQEDDDDVEDNGSEEEAGEDTSGDEDVSDEDMSDEEAWESEESEQQSEEDPDKVAARKLATVSFDTLSKAQSLAPSKKRKREENTETDEKLAALKLRLKELQNNREFNSLSKERAEEQDESEQDEDDADSDEEDYTSKKGRSSKHAPTSMSSKRQVTRRRDAVQVPKANIRDPRFDPIADLDREKIRKNYSFLDDYVDSEIKDIKATLKTQKTPKSGVKNKKKVKAAPKLSEEEVDALKRELVQKESKRAAQKARDRHSDVLKEHKQKERELVKTGKKAYFLKNSEVKEKVLIKQFEGMSEGKREKAMEKKRRRIASKERKNMPDTRRVVENSLR